MVNHEVPKDSPTHSLQLAGYKGDHFDGGLPSTWKDVERLRCLDHSIKRKFEISQKGGRYMSGDKTLTVIFFGVILLLVGNAEMMVMGFLLFGLAAIGGWYHWMVVSRNAQLRARTRIRDRRAQSHFGFNNVARHLALEGESETYDRLVSEYLTRLRVGSNDPATRAGQEKQKVVDQ